MQKSLFTLFIYCKILFLSIFRANLKNDQKNDINVQFSHPLQTVCTNQSGSKETLYFFFICRNQIFHYQLSFWHIWKKSWKFWRFFEKSNQKINELFNFNFKFQNEFLSGDKSDNEKKEPQPYTLTQEKNHLHICYTFWYFFHFSISDNAWILALRKMKTHFWSMV